VSIGICGYSNLAKPDFLGSGTSVEFFLGLGVREAERRNNGCAAGYGDDPAFLGTTDLGHSQVCEEKVAEMVDGKVLLETVDGGGACWLSIL
jgi:hypothetical protein